MYNLKNNTKLSAALCTLLCVVRLFAFLPLILVGAASIPLMWILGITDPFGVWTKINEMVVFDVND
jgi:hypothetical protein